MDCTRFEDLLFESLEGDLLDTEEQSLQAHANSCTRCREFAALMRAEAADGSSEVPVDLVAGVLERTSGGACERAQLLLADRADGALGEDGSLLSMHLGGCADCAAVARALVHLQHELPTLAQLDPGAGFVAAVMDATVGRAAPAPARIPLRARIEETWERLSQRPRLAFEGAYAGIVLLFLIFGLPSQSLAELPARAYDGLRQEGIKVERVVSAGVGELFDFGRTTWTESSARVDAYFARADSAPRDASALERTARYWAGVARDVATSIWDGLLAPIAERLRELWSGAPPAAVNPEQQS